MLHSLTRSLNHNLPDNCGSVSFSACAKFILTFDRLYKARPETYPDGNPMLIDPSDTIATSVSMSCFLPFLYAVESHTN